MILRLKSFAKHTDKSIMETNLNTTNDLPTGTVLTIDGRTIDTDTTSAREIIRMIGSSRTGSAILRDATTNEVVGSIDGRGRITSNGSTIVV